MGSSEPHPIFHTGGRPVCLTQHYAVDAPDSKPVGFDFAGIDALASLCLPPRGGPVADSTPRRHLASHSASHADAGDLRCIDFV